MSEQDRVSNTHNPLRIKNSEELRKLIDDMKPAMKLTPEEEREAEEVRRTAWENYQKARYGELPANIYRILEQGGFVGWTYPPSSRFLATKPWLRSLPRQRSQAGLAALLRTRRSSCLPLAAASDEVSEQPANIASTRRKRTT